MRCAYIKSCGWCVSIGANYNIACNLNLRCRCALVPITHIVFEYQCQFFSFRIRIIPLEKVVSEKSFPKIHLCFIVVCWLAKHSVKKIPPGIIYLHAAYTALQVMVHVNMHVVHAVLYCGEMVCRYIFSANMLFNPLAGKTPKL